MQTKARIADFSLHFLFPKARLEKVYNKLINKILAVKVKYCKEYLHDTDV